MHRFLLFSLVAATGCVSAPHGFSARSAASAQTASAPRVSVGRALTEEPPAPGASTEGWAGLGGSAAPTDAHAHHHTMTMPDGTVMEMDAMPGASDAH